MNKCNEYSNDNECLSEDWCFPNKAMKNGKMCRKTQQTRWRETLTLVSLQMEEAGVDEWVKQTHDFHPGDGGLGVLDSQFLRLQFCCIRRQNLSWRLSDSSCSQSWLDAANL